AAYYNKQRRYDKALCLAREAEASAFKLGQLDYQYLSCLMLHDIYKAMDRDDEALVAYERADSIKAFIEHNQQVAEVNALALQYETKEKTADLNNEKQRSGFLSHALYLALALLLLLSGLAFALQYLYRKKKRAYRDALRLIEEMQVRAATREKDLLGSEQLVPAPLADSFLPEERDRMEKLCRSLRDAIYKDKCYLEPEISRDALVRRFGTNRNRFNEAFHICFPDVDSLSTLLNDLRLQEAVAFLEKTDWTMEMVAEKSGLGSLRSFQRLFSNRYGLSPAAFRRRLAEEAGAA
ncbi:MAG: helix-turn-helix domain-containing protein, partial [Tannerella sp.]|nr:helix-turn-helix domain-containing protein [Tannerella sp.]